MNNIYLIIGFIVIFVLGGSFFYFNSKAKNTQRLVQEQLRKETSLDKSGEAEKDNKDKEDLRDMILAGGCFWCVEADMEKADGVVEVVSGYSGGDGLNPTYENYYKKGHREVVKVVYDSEEVSFKELLYYFIKHIDPTDGKGSFVDRGVQYSPAIYYEDEKQKEIAEKVLEDIGSRNVFDEKLRVPVLERGKFWRAEEYHQDYYKKNPLKYKTYRKYSGRDGFIERHWGDTTDVIPDLGQKNKATSSDSTELSNESWKSFEKPGKKELKKRLSNLEYKVTQNNGTEPAYDNEYWNNDDPGIYVDVVSKEPLFSSKNKYKSGTGWPSFTKPLVPENIVTEPDYLLGYRRTEVKSRIADSHLGHVFNDGPQTLEESGGAEPTGLRYCLNSAALEFIPKEDLEERGYEKFKSIFN